MGVPNFKLGYLKKEVEKATGFREDQIFIESFSDKYIDYVIYEKDDNNETSGIHYTNKGRLERI
jgi:hypothetical protein